MTVSLAAARSPVAETHILTYRMAAADLLAYANVVVPPSATITVTQNGQDVVFTVRTDAGTPPLGQPCPPALPDTGRDASL